MSYEIRMSVLLKRIFSCLALKSCIYPIYFHQLMNVFKNATYTIPARLIIILDSFQPYAQYDIFSRLYNNAVNTDKCESVKL